jgi:hypothetical protein
MEKHSGGWGGGGGVACLHAWLPAWLPDLTLAGWLAESEDWMAGWMADWGVRACLCCCGPFPHSSPLTTGCLCSCRCLPAESFAVDIGGPFRALLPVLAFEGATKRNRPHLQVGGCLAGWPGAGCRCCAPARCRSAGNRCRWWWWLFGKP